MAWIEELVREWTNEDPQLDFSSLPPLIRLARLGTLIDDFQADVLEPFELTRADYAVLATLRRAGQPFALNPSQLYGRLHRSSGGMTKILKRLEQAALVERTRDPEDGRGTLVVLTARGRTLHDRVFRAFAAASSRLLTKLSDQEKAEIDLSLKRTLDCLEGEPASTSQPFDSPAGRSSSDSS
ncbi:MAG: MarR family transcriptional regulator [Proteobacteria bacterium]|nr:MarR family transcriptional regulator [Pseudomonadota bacterium]